MVQAQPVQYVQYVEQMQQRPMQLYPMQTMSAPRYAPVEYETFEPPPVEVREREEESFGLSREKKTVQRSAGPPGPPRTAPPPPPEEEPEEEPILKKEKKKVQRSAGPKVSAPPPPPPPPEQKIEIRKVEVEVDKVHNSCAQAVCMHVQLCLCLVCTDSLSRVVHLWS